ncbi:hypothetical protein DL765_001265 [Monosporascus sp. GIB2]|nr:hypothetical protein DL765_001265 [Monosporascus sp. GIB2]
MKRLAGPGASGTATTRKWWATTRRAAWGQRERGVAARAEAAVPQRYRPDVYLVDTGTNDRAPGIAIPSSGGRTGVLVDYLQGPRSRPPSCSPRCCPTATRPSTAASATSTGSSGTSPRSTRPAAGASCSSVSGVRAASPRTHPGRHAPQRRGTRDDGPIRSNGLLDADTRGFLQEAV